MFGLGPTELIVVFLIILLVFGAKRIPEIAQGIGKGIMEFKRAARDISTELDTADHTPPRQQPRNELRPQYQQPVQQVQQPVQQVQQPVQQPVQPVQQPVDRTES
jgi:sec-independent protein translocase protein TatA